MSEEIECGFVMFVIRLWVEQTPDEIPGGRWRGHIAHLPDGQPQYVQRMGEITSFIEDRLRSMGLQP